MDRKLLREMRRGGTATWSPSGSTFTPGPLHPVDAMEDRLKRMTQYARDVEMLYRSTGADSLAESNEWIAKCRSNRGITDADMEEGSTP